MKEEKFQQFQLLIQGLTALGTLGIAISICVSIYSIKEAQEANRLAQESNYQLHDWYRRSYTVDIIRDFEGHVVEYRTTLQDAFPGLFDKEKRGVVEPGTAENLWLGHTEPNSKYDFMKDKKKVERVRNQLVGLLNYLEYLAQTYNVNVIDQDAFDKSIADPMILYHDVFYEFIMASQRHLKYKNWQPLLDAVSDIREKRRGDVAGPKSPVVEEKSNQHSK